MRDKTQPISWKVNCKRPADLQKAESVARSEAEPDRVLKDAARTTPGGVENIVTTYYRVGDYFQSVQVFPDEQNAFRIVFYPRPNAGRYWKDLMANVLRAVRDSAEGVSIRPAQRAQ
jgi:hypothetical protein